MASRTSQSSPRSSIDTARGSVDKERPASTEPIMSRQSTETLESKPTEHESPAAEPVPVVEPSSTSAESEPANSQEIQDTTTPIIIEPHSEFRSQDVPTQQATGKTEAQLKSLDTSNVIETAQATDMPEILPQKEQASGIKSDRARSEEIQEYIEQIDSLQAKLQYLSKNAVDIAKQAANSAAAGSAERKLAEKDEKIALLMGEGQKLSTSEQKFRITVRKLRSQIAENEKQANELRRDKEKAVAETEALRSRINSKEEQDKRNEEVRKASAALQKEIDALKKDKLAGDDAYRRLEQESKAKAEQTQSAYTEALNKALDVEKKRQKELESSIATLRSEKEALVEKLRLTEVEWQEKLDRAVERGRNVEEELKLELRAAESKLEAMRVAAEEASAGSGGDIKLIRHIETLQSQYASASENWQGIETSLLTKAANLEKERDEAQRRESEMRKKARDSVSRMLG